MKCKDCSSMCKYRTSDGERECYYSQPQPKVMTRQEYNREASTHATCNWVEVRNKAAIAAMQGTITILSNSDRYAFSEIVVDGFGGHDKTYPNEIAEFAIACADELIKQLKGE